MTDLRGDDRLVTSPAQRLSEQPLAQAVFGAVDVGRVEEGDPRVEGRPHDFGRTILRLRARAGATQVVAPEADDRYSQRRGSQGARLHPLRLRPVLDSRARSPSVRNVRFPPVSVGGRGYARAMTLPPLSPEPAALRRIPSPIGRI